MKTKKTLIFSLTILFFVSLMVKSETSTEEYLAQNKSGFKFEISFQENAVSEVK